MSIFQKTVPSVKVSKKIDNLQAQLRGIENQVASKGIQIEKAVVGGEIPDKLFTEAANLKIKEDVAKGVLSKMQAEYEAAQTREEHAVKTAELDRFERIFEKKFATLKSNLKDFVEAGKSLLEREDAIGAQYRELFAIPVPRGITATGLLPVDFARIIHSLTIKIPIDFPAHAIATAERETTSLLSSNGNDTLARIAMARRVLNEEAEAPAPDPEPVAVEAPKKPPVDGGKLLYREQRREGIARLKVARDAKETSQDESVRAAVAEMDQEADSGGSLVDRYKPMSHFVK